MEPKVTRLSPGVPGFSLMMKKKTEPPGGARCVDADEGGRRQLAPLRRRNGVKQLGLEPKVTRLSPGVPGFSLMMKKKRRRASV